jgi:ABC-type Mn2+/Zn2+ transport system permease subunit
MAILVAWALLDALIHRLFLAPIYEASSGLWRPFDQMSTALISAVTIALIAVFVGTYRLLVRPKSFGAGLALGAFVGVALGISSGFGAFIHMPISLPLAWGWFVGGSLKGLVAGGIVGAVITDRIRAAA